MINTAIIGFGMSGKSIHFPLLKNHKAYNIKTVVSSRKETQGFLKSQGLNANVLTNYEEVLRDKSIDLIVLAVPNSLHADFTKRAIEAGKHIIVEKPFVQTYKEAKRLFEFAKEKGVVLRVFHNRKYDGDFMTVKEHLDNDNLGKLISFSARFDRFMVEPQSGWRTQAGLMSGVFYDLGPHLFHYAISLFGPPKQVKCDLYRDHLGLSTDDHFEATLYYDSLHVTLGAEQFARYPLPKFHVKGLKGSYIKEGFDHPEVVFEPLKEAYQKSLTSKNINNDLEETNVLVRQSAHYEWYTVLKDDIEHSRLETKESIISLQVIKAMEEALKNH